ncbi:MAG: 5'-nucleotidase C-terminal domain-containing protein [Bacteroidales bacterium]|nr:5'-nucleotidase C-terminal domain-containing protein [Bacteroidales bacterium]
MKHFILSVAAAALLFLGLPVAGVAYPILQKPVDGEYTIHLFTTGDIHGCYFDSTYVGGNTRHSLFCAAAAVGRARQQYGEENVILLDGGDALQGDNAAYYYNYVETEKEHVFSRMARYMGYDALVVGNHDIETGHEVYDRVNSTLGIPYLAGNALKDDGSSYFGTCTVFYKGAKGKKPQPRIIGDIAVYPAGGYQGSQIKVAVLGYTNANISSWLDKSKWYGMTFARLSDIVQADVDKVRAERNPDVVIVVCHSGTGKGSHASLENEGYALKDKLTGVNFLVCAHDHTKYCEKSGNMVLLNSGSNCRSMGHGTITVTVKDKKTEVTAISGETVDLDKNDIDEKMKEAFREDYLAVKEFTLKKVGALAMPLHSREAYSGMSDYTNLISTVCLKVTGADICFTAPLKFDAHINAGDVIFDDMFSIYPFENTLVKLRMSGRQIKGFLEYSYNMWLSDKPSEHILGIGQGADERTGARQWHFNRGRSYNFDQAAGLIYTVNYRKHFGSRVKIKRLADGRKFRPGGTYSVAMTSYRANGGGGAMPKGAGIKTADLENVTLETYSEIRTLIYNYIKEAGKTIGCTDISDESILGNWHFVPEASASVLMKQDMDLLFPR